MTKLRAHVAAYRQMLDEVERCHRDLFELRLEWGRGAVDTIRSGTALGMRQLGFASAPHAERERYEFLVGVGKHVDETWKRLLAEESRGGFGSHEDWHSIEARSMVVNEALEWLTANHKSSAVSDA
jgi:hypothetical protein